MAITGSLRSRSALRTFPVFAALDDAALARVDHAAERVEVRAGSVLSEDERLGRQAFIVLEGRADVCIADTRRCELVPGELVTEMALRDHLPPNATVTAATPMRLLLLDPHEFLSLLELRPIVLLVLATIGRLRVATAPLAVSMS